MGDAAEALAIANLSYGLAKIQAVEARLGLEPTALFVGAPDLTVTRNPARWRQGFGYGGQLSWHPELAVLDAKPNGCGMLVSAVSAPPDEETVRGAAEQARAAALELDGVALSYDLGDSNHFVDALELEELLDSTFTAPAHLIVIHSSGHEHRPSSPFGPGLYLDESEELRRLARRLETEWGTLSVLTGEEASRYHAFCERVQLFNARRRELYARVLFGEHSPICNLTHQGMRAPGVFQLGAYGFAREAAERSVVPLTLGPDQPVYLLRPRPSFSEAAIARLGWTERAERLGLTARLRSADLLPHGGGYAFPDLARLLRVESLGGDRRRFVLEDRAGESVEVEDVRALPFVYRDLEVLARIRELELARPLARYRIRFVIK